MTTPNQDAGDEHVDPANDPVHGFHLVWAARNAFFTESQRALGVVARCGDWVPRHWAVTAPELVTCKGCRA